MVYSETPNAEARGPLHSLVDQFHSNDLLGPSTTPFIDSLSRHLKNPDDPSTCYRIFYGVNTQGDLATPTEDWLLELAPDQHERDGTLYVLPHGESTVYRLVPDPEEEPSSWWYDPEKLQALPQEEVEGLTQRLNGVLLHESDRLNRRRSEIRERRLASNPLKRYLGQLASLLSKL